MVVPSGFNDRAVLAICRVLERRGDAFAVVGRGSGDAIRQTRYGSRLVGDVGRDLDVDEWLDVMAGVPRPAVVLPTSEFLNRWLLQHRATLTDAGLSPALGDAGPYLRLSDKGSFRAWAAEEGLPLPPLVEAPLATAPLPFAAKPVREYGDDGSALRPWLVESEHDRADLLAARDPDDYVLETMIGGASWYVLAHVDGDGEPRWATQRNAAQQPGGRSVVAAWSATAPTELGAEDVVDALVRSGHRGLVMVEVKADEGGPRLIEANPRPWGPLQLTVDADTGLVDAWLDDLLGRPRRPEPTWRAGVPYLWLGGIAATRRDHGRLRWFAGGRREVRRRWPAFLRHDVHWRPDAWREGVRQLRGGVR